MNHPDNQNTMQKNHDSVPYEQHALDRLGKRSSAHTGRGYIGAARDINDIMADLEKGDEKTVVFKNLSTSRGSELDKQAISGANEMTSGDSGLTTYRLNVDDGYNFSEHVEPEDIGEIAEDVDLLRVYDARGADESFQDDNGFLEDSRTYGISNVVLEIGTDQNPRRDDFSMQEPSGYAESAETILNATGYDHTAVTHDVSHGNDYVWASEEELQ